MLRYLGQVIRKRPWTTFLVLSLLILAGTGAGLYVYALRQWEAAQVAIKEDRLVEARSKLDFCLMVWPRSVPVHLLAARAARLSADYQVAESHLNRCLKLQQGASEAIQLEFLLLRVQTGEVDEVASPLLDSVEKQHPESPMILETLARSYMHRLRYRRAYACLSRWIEETPDSAKPYHWRGWVQERLNNPKRAMEDYQCALERDPDLFVVRLRVAEMLLEDRKTPEALAHVERLRNQFPDRPDVMARLGQCRFLQGQTEEARRLLEAAVQRLPDDSSLLIHLAKLDLQEGRPAEAEQWLRRVLKADPFDAEAGYTLVSALQLQGRREDADAALDQYEKNKALPERASRLLKEEAEHPTNTPDTPSEIGTLMLRMGKEHLGVYWLEQALLRDQGYLPAHRALAEYYEKKGEQETAATHRRWLREPDRKSNKGIRKQADKASD